MVFDNSVHLLQTAPCVDASAESLPFQQQVEPPYFLHGVQTALAALLSQNFVATRAAHPLLIASRSNATNFPKVCDRQAKQFECGWTRRKEPPSQRGILLEAPKSRLQSHLHTDTLH